jgi:beta-aspartyl-dipeptidase (metallo-type)
MPAAAPHVPDPALTVLRDADVYAPAPLGRRHLLIGGGRVLWMGTDLPPLPAALPVDEVDLAGARLVPGLVDGHTHLTGGGGEAGPHTRVPPVPLSRFTRAGVTTVVGVLGTDDLTRTPAEVVAAARGLEVEGISAWCHTGGYHLPPATITGQRARRHRARRPRDRRG